MSIKLLKVTSIFLGIALVVCLAFLVRMHLQVYGAGGWKDVVHKLAELRGNTVAVDDLHSGKLRLYEFAGQQDATKFSGRRDGAFEIWYPEFNLPMSRAWQYGSKEFVASYNDTMINIHEHHPEMFPPEADARTNNLELALPAPSPPRLR